ncbi:TrbI/VirB10 family protein [Leptothoe sp. ISB3NOV94-8A]
MSDEPTLESLREMTGAPNLDDTLVSETAFDAVEMKSERPAWKMPGPKLIAVGIALVPVFGIAGYFMLASRQTDKTDIAASEASTDTEVANEIPSITEVALEESRNEVARLKSNMALSDQAYVQQQSQEAAKPKSSSSPTTTPAPPKVTTKPAVSRPAPVVSASPRPAPAIDYRPTPRPVQATPPRPAPAVTAAASPRFSDTDPTERWQTLARLGSYGTVTPIEPAEETETADGDNGVETIPVAQISPHSVMATVPTQSPPAPEESEPEVIPEEPAPLELSEPILLANTQSSIPEISEPLPLENTLQAQASPEALRDAEARILEEPIQPPSLMSGTYASGELTTPVVLNESEQSSRYVVRLNEPLMDNRGRTAIPSESDLTVEVEPVGDDRLVEISAVSASWQEGNNQQEILLPDAVVQIRGADGHPLIAQGYGDPGGEIAALDASEVALGAVRRASELYTRPNTRVQTNDNSTVVTEENPDPNILAGALEGGTDVLLDILSERNQQARDAIAQRPQVLYLEENTPVQVFVNASMQLPM